MSVMEDTRDRILASASAQIQRHGHIKTTVADVAKHCGMSPANIYRFFPTKAALIEAVSEIWLSMAEDNARAIARQPGRASARVREYILGVHEFNRDRYTRDGEVHETCVAATSERWPIIFRHEKILTDIFAAILKDGVDAGEFEIDDVDQTAAIMISAMVKFHNPIMVAQYHTESLTEQAVALSDFMLKAILKR